MTKPLTYIASRKGLTIGGAIAIGMMLSGCMSPEQKKQVHLMEDRDACSSMGAAYGSSAYTKCMLQQQQRRDEAHTRYLEQANLGYEMAHTAQKMREKAED